MTLIISCLTPKYIVQVSDRRLTWPDGRVFDETANKAIVFHGRASIAYTGIAVIGSQRTDEWIADQILNCTGVQDAIDTLKRALDARIVQLAAPNRGLTVCVDLWGAQGGGTLDRAWSVALTNQIDPQTRKPTEKPLPIFQQFTQNLPDNNTYAFLPLGERLEAGIYRRMVRNLVRVMRNKGNPSAVVAPETVARLMRDAVLDTARWSRFVGENVMTTVLYNFQLPEYQGRPNTFMFHLDSKSEPILYAPTLINPGLTMKGFRMYPGPPRFETK